MNPRALQGLLAVVLVTVGIAFVDWRAAMVAAGAFLFLDYAVSTRRRANE